MMQTPLGFLAEALTNRSVQTLVVLLGVFTLAMKVIDRVALVTTVSAVLFVVSLAVVITYMRALYPIIIEKRVSRTDYLILGIICSWCSDAALRAWGTIYRLTSRPEWMVDHPVTAYALLFGAVGGVLHLTAPNAIDGRVPRADWIRTGWVIGLGVGLSVILLTQLAD